MPLPSPRLSLAPRLTLALAVTASAGCLALEEPEETGTAASPQVMLNQVMLNQVMLNGLTGTISNLEALISSPLASKTFSPVGPLPHALMDPDARTFMTYLVSCALTGEDVITWTHPLYGHHYKWQGALGRCPAWADGAPDKPCRERVSACLLARENLEGKSVAISQRGLSLDGPLALEEELPPKPTTLEGDLVSSLAPCVGFASGPTRNCGWDAHASRLGTCAPGEDVILECEPGSDTLVVRVCDGIEACDHGDPRVLAEATACGKAADTVSFTCGEDGAFAAMIGPPKGHTTFSQSLWSGSFAGASGAEFPAREGALFAIAEGAFYGDIFNPASRHPGVTVTINPSNGEAFTTFAPGVADGDVIYQDAYACHAPEWSAGQAYMLHRLCAVVPNEGQTDDKLLCLARSLGPCTAPDEPSRCSTSDAQPEVGDGDYGGCEDGEGAVRDWPVTVYLHQPCDVVSSPRACRRP